MKILKKHENYDYTIYIRNIINIKFNIIKIIVKDKYN